MPLSLQIINAYIHCTFKAWQLNTLPADPENFDGNSIVLQTGKLASKDRLAATAWLMENYPESSAVFVSYGAEPVKTATVRLKLYAAKAQKLLQEVKLVIAKQGRRHSIKTATAQNASSGKPVIANW